MKRLVMILVPAALALSACGSAGKLPKEKVDNPKDEVVDIGYGSTSREALGFAVDKVNVDEAAIRSYVNIADYLRSRVPGVEVNPNGTVQIRGQKTFTGPAEALVVVDDVICNNINTINPNQIHSVQVLKDGGSTAIYGSRGGNGVLLITTKMAYQAEQERIAARKAEKEARKAAKKNK